ncbi:hypothetical protein TNCV_4598931 [Trichonephila clavipes]|nr:hypothetical protein TNCV_4598931 [Trichonephila clavipes]
MLYWRKISGDLAGHGRTSYPEDIVGRVTQYVDEHYPVDKWHLGDLMAWVAQSALKYRPQIAPHTVTPCEIAVCRSTINAGSDRWPVRLETRVRWSSAETEDKDSSQEDDVSVCHTQVAEVGKNPVDAAMMWGSVVSVLADVGSSSPSVGRLLMVSLDGTGCLEGEDVLTSRRYTLPSVIPLLPTPSNYHIAPDRGGGRYVYSTSLLL